MAKYTKKRYPKWTPFDPSIELTKKLAFYLGNFLPETDQEYYTILTVDQLSWFLWNHKDTIGSNANACRDLKNALAHSPTSSLKTFDEGIRKIVEGMLQP